MGDGSTLQNDMAVSETSKTIVLVSSALKSVSAHDFEKRNVKVLKIDNFLGGRRMDCCIRVILCVV